MTKLQFQSTAAFCTDQIQYSKTQHRTGSGTKDYTGGKKQVAESSFSGSSHHASDCLKYANNNDRLEVAKRKGLCFNCLKKHQDGSHFAAPCERATSRKCVGKHQTALHKERNGKKKKEDTSKTI